ncbi:hypothetical protein P171DRAFT_439873 [Karstenula rhodostoma CBS 690.94]|uniref:Uncharacterized protein n=1 Tax=Karstenula rhodostoma CBS 690.94 TaxID=1392251 RepID=A0A9P4PRZ9_9PLEO|nr:hypothetical protein P171DRAFT_439873 [Karstenula rhodostoma CBS 690.94]
MSQALQPGGHANGVSALPQCDNRILSRPLRYRRCMYHRDPISNEAVWIDEAPMNGERRSTCTRAVSSERHRQFHSYRRRQESWESKARIQVLTLRGIKRPFTTTMASQDPSRPSSTRLDDSDHSQATVQDSDLYARFLSKTSHDDAALNSVQPPRLETSSAVEILAIDAKSWIEELKRDLAQQSERITALEQKNQHLTHLLAKYKAGFDTLREAASNIKSLLSATGAKSGKDGTSKKRKEVQFS